MAIDLEKQQVRLRPKQGANFDFSQFEKAFNDAGFAQVQLLANPKPAEKSSSGAG